MGKCKYHGASSFFPILSRYVEEELEDYLSLLKFRQISCFSKVRKERVEAKETRGENKVERVTEQVSKVISFVVYCVHIDLD